MSSDSSSAVLVQREGQHDDLVLAVALVAWFEEHMGRVDALPADGDS